MFPQYQKSTYQLNNQRLLKGQKKNKVNILNLFKMDTVDLSNHISDLTKNTLYFV